MNYNILIVDDSRTVRAVIAKALRITKIQTENVFEAENGKIGLEIVADNKIDLIFADINMPIMNGIEMIEKLKANSATSLIPIVVVSTEASLARTTRLETIGVHATIQKPFHPEQLRVVVNDALEGSHDV